MADETTDKRLAIAIAALERIAHEVTHKKGRPERPSCVSVPYLWEVANTALCHLGLPHDQFAAAPPWVHNTQVTHG